MNFQTGLDDLKNEIAGPSPAISHIYQYNQGLVI